MSVRLGEFEVTPERLRWLVVDTKDVGEQARLLDVISEIEKREREESGTNLLRLAVQA